MCGKLLQLCPTLFESMHCSLPGFSVHGNSPGKNTAVVYTEVAVPPLGDLPDPGIEPRLMSPALAGRFFTTSTTWEAHFELNHTLKSPISKYSHIVS